MINQISKNMIIPQILPTSCKRCKNARIRFVYDMRIWWVECDRCWHTYMTKDHK